MRNKNLQKQHGKDQHRIDSYGRSWEKPSFSCGLTMADDDDDDDDDADDDDDDYYYDDDDDDDGDGARNGEERSVQAV